MGAKLFFKLLKRIVIIPKVTSLLRSTTDTSSCCKVLMSTDYISSSQCMSCDLSVTSEGAFMTAAATAARCAMGFNLGLRLYGHSKGLKAINIRRFLKAVYYINWINARDLSLTLYCLTGFWSMSGCRYSNLELSRYFGYFPSCM